MKVRLEADPDGGAFLQCATCHTDFMSADNGDLDHITLVGIVQTHDLDCPGEKISEPYLFHDLCGERLFHFRGTPQILKCGFCNRTISPAEQVRHEIKWVTRASYNFRPGCCCGWTSEHGHMLEKDAQAEFDRHPRQTPKKIRRVK